LCSGHFISTFLSTTIFMEETCTLIDHLESICIWCFVTQVSCIVELWSTPSLHNAWCCVGVKSQWTWMWTHGQIKRACILIARAVPCSSWWPPPLDTCISQDHLWWIVYRSKFSESAHRSEHTSQSIFIQILSIDLSLSEARMHNYIWC
jgi:hypothetical protein